MATSPRPRLTRAQARQAFLAQAAEAWDQLTAWSDDHPSAPLRDLEPQVTRLRRDLVEGLLDLHFQRGDGGALLTPPNCATCGRPQRPKGEVAKTVQTTEGSLTLHRAYYACEACGGGLFPPGPASAPGADGVE